MDRNANSASSHIGKATAAHLSQSRDEITQCAIRATPFLKALAHEGRIMTLCHLSTGEHTVGELEDLLGQRQAAVSQQLARLRSEGLVKSRSKGQTRLYSLADPRVEQLVNLICKLFSKD